MTFVLNLLLASTGSLAFAILYNVPRKFYLCAAFTGMAGWFCYYLIVPFTDTAVASFFGDCCCAAVADFRCVEEMSDHGLFDLGDFPACAGSRRLLYHVLSCVK